MLKLILQQEKEFMQGVVKLQIELASLAQELILLVRLKLEQKVELLQQPLVASQVLTGSAELI